MANTTIDVQITVSACRCNSDRNIVATAAQAHACLRSLRLATDHESITLAAHVDGQVLDAAVLQAASRAEERVSSQADVICSHRQLPSLLIEVIIHRELIV